MISGYLLTLGWIVDTMDSLHHKRGLYVEYLGNGYFWIRVWSFLYLWGILEMKANERFKYQWIGYLWDFLGLFYVWNMKQLEMVLFSSSHLGIWYSKWSTGKRMGILWSQKPAVNFRHGRYGLYGNWCYHISWHRGIFEIQSTFLRHRWKLDCRRRWLGNSFLTNSFFGMLQARKCWLC